MLARCPVCDAHFVPETGIELSGAGEARRVCSVRCAESERAAAALATIPPLPKRLLVAVDGSGPSLRAAALAAALAGASDGEVRLLSAVDPRLLRAFDWLTGTRAALELGIKPEEVDRTLREEAQAQLAGAERLCREAGVRVRTSVVLQAPLEAIREASQDADLVLLGSRGLGAVSGALLGSLSHRLIAACKKPVLVVH